MNAMATRRILILGLFALFALIGCNPTERVEQVDDYDYKEVFHLSKKTGKKSGTYEKFYPDGNLYEKAEFNEGELHGERQLLFPNGQVEVLENYVNGQYQGIAKTYYEGGQLRNEGQYNDNAADGIWKSFYSNGQLKEEVVYVQNEEQGPFKEWHENGNIKAQGTYKDGDNEDGELKLFDENGQLLRKMDCKMGACKTVWKSATATDET